MFSQRGKFGGREAIKNGKTKRFSGCAGVVTISRQRRNVKIKTYCYDAAAAGALCDFGAERRAFATVLRGIYRLNVCAHVPPDCRYAANKRPRTKLASGSTRSGIKILHCPVKTHIAVLFDVFPQNYFRFFLYR